MARKACAFHVPRRQYGEAGPCQSRREIRKIKLNDVVVLGCIVHRQMLSSGRQAVLTKSQRAATMTA
jgi:hypothetical protein